MRGVKTYALTPPSKVAEIETPKAARCCLRGGTVASAARVMIALHAASSGGFRFQNVEMGRAHQRRGSGVKIV